MKRMNGLRYWSVASAAVFALVAVNACGDEAAEDGAGTGGSAGVGTGGASGVGTAGQGAAGSGGAGGTGGGTSSGGTDVGGAPGTGGSGGTAGEDVGTAGSEPGGSGATAEVLCLTSDPQQGNQRATDNYIECDWEQQSIDFTVAADYAAVNPAWQPGYDPAETTVTVTDFGTAITGHAVQSCHPYCFASNLTIGVNLVAADPDSLRGEILFDFPPSLAPIANAVGRDSLGWVYLDGPALPAGATVTAKLVLQNSDGIVFEESGTLDLAVGQWREFKYFPIQNGFNAADLVNITAIGFRFAVTTDADWSGVIYADHFQLRG